MRICKIDLSETIYGMGGPGMYGGSMLPSTPLLASNGLSPNNVQFAIAPPNISLSPSASTPIGQNPTFSLTGGDPNSSTPGTAPSTAPSTTTSPNVAGCPPGFTAGSVSVTTTQNSGGVVASGNVHAGAGILSGNVSGTYTSPSSSTTTVSNVNTCVRTGAEATTDTSSTTTASTNADNDGWGEG
jgi:hypothetical protein